MGGTATDERATLPESVPDTYVERFSGGDEASREANVDVLTEIWRARDAMLTKSEIEGRVDHSGKTVGRALNDLRGDDIVVFSPKTQDTLCYLNHPATEYPKPPDLQSPSELMEISAREFISLNNLDQLRVATVGMFIGAAGFMAVGVFLLSFNIRLETGRSLMHGGFWNFMGMIALTAMYMAGDKLDDYR